MKRFFLGCVGGRIGFELGVRGAGATPFRWRTHIGQASAANAKEPSAAACNNTLDSIHVDSNHAGNGIHVDPIRASIGPSTSRINARARNSRST